MKKTFSILLISILVLSLLSGCDLKEKLNGDNSNINSSTNRESNNEGQTIMPNP